LVSPVAFKLPGDPDTTVAAALYAPEGDRQLDALFVFAHGAGAGHFHPFMTNYASGLAARGVTVVTFNFPTWKSGATPDRAPVLEDAFRRAVAGAVEHRHVKASKLFIGGKSMGGRMATHLGAISRQWPAAPKPSGIALRLSAVAAAQQTHRRSRDPSQAADVPTLIVQGTRDPFGGPDEIKEAIADAPRRRRSRSCRSKAAIIRSRC
jgi:predicted alpha/beta-hydrolase family hydrolase